MPFAHVHPNGGRHFLGAGLRPVTQAASGGGAGFFPDSADGQMALVKSNSWELHEPLVTTPITTEMWAGRYAIQFDTSAGSNSKYLEAAGGNNPSAPGAAWSWTGWVYSRNSGRRTLAKYDTATLSDGWLIEQNGLQLRGYWDGGSQLYAHTTNMINNWWNFVAVVWNTDTWTMYTGPLMAWYGLSSSTNTPGAPSPTYTNAGYSVGGDPLTSLTQEFNDRMAGCALWDTDLSSGAVNTLWNDGFGVQFSDLSAGFKSTNSLVAWHQMNDASGGAVDSHTGGHDLTETGSGTFTYRDDGPAQPIPTIL